jgi:hypothetical protein
MKVKVTGEGALIPRKFLKGVKEVEVRRQNGLIVVMPVSKDQGRPVSPLHSNVGNGIPKDDPIYDLGKNPVACGVTDASENLDKYLYRVE